MAVLAATIPSVSEHLLISIAAILLVGVGTQWIAWRLQLPAILLLLVAGFLVGPVGGVVDPDDLLGDLLTPFVSISVALILFEGGLTLNLRELRSIGGVAVVRNLTTVGAVITWAIASAAGVVILGFGVGVATLLGAILIVTGPTVIGPLLRHVRPAGVVGAILRWEGILIDPIGAVLAVLVFESILAGELGKAASVVAAGAARAALIGTGIGLGGAAVLVLLLRRYLVPDFLHNAMSIGFVVGAFIGANELQRESGLIAVTVMGITLATQQFTPVRHILEFKENLRVILISVLFIVLAARLDLQGVLEIGPRGLAYVGVLVVAARPLAVAVSTARSSLKRGERLFLAAVAPRGIVAASISSIFALRLAEEGVPGGDDLVAAAFTVVALTIAVYGVTASWVARRLGLAEKHPRGILVVGANPLAREIARALRDEGFDVLLADTDRSQIASARVAGFRTFYGSILSDHAFDPVDLGGIGRVLALTSNDELNALACQHLAHIVGRAEVYQVAPERKKKHPRFESLSHHQGGRVLFGEDLAYDELARLLDSGASLKTTPITKDFDFEAYLARHAPRVVPMFVVGESGVLLPFAANGPPEPKPGQRILGLVAPPEGEGDDVQARPDRDGNA